MKNDATLPLVVSANIQEKQTEQHSVERAGERKTARAKTRSPPSALLNERVPPPPPPLESN
jgi:hypothetical protein